jgi:hypothetical protein
MGIALVGILSAIHKTNFNKSEFNWLLGGGGVISSSGLQH